MMQKRTLYSLLLISFLVVFAASVSANEVIIQSKSNLLRCNAQEVNVTASVTTAGVSAVEGVFEVSNADACGWVENLGVEWLLDDGVLSERIIDLSQADGVSPDTIRIAAMRIDQGDGFLANGSTVIAKITFTTTDCCEGQVLIDNAIFDYPNNTGTITTQFVNEADATVLAVAVTPGTLGISNSDPHIDAVADQTLPWGTVLNLQLSADDNDLDQGCEELKYALVDGPAGVSVTLGGQLQWLTGDDQVCEHVISVRVYDLCGAADTTDINVCVTNEPPTIACPDDQLMFFGDVLVLPTVADDPDDGPYAMIYSLASTTAPGGVTVDPGTGVVTFETENTAEYTGTFQICVAVTDSANVCDPCSPENADTCCFNVEVRGAAVTIEKQHGDDGLGVIQGQPTTVSIDILDPDFHSWSIAGFDLLMQYDHTALTLIDVEEGTFFTDCGWEYFTYRYGPNGNCTGGCPSGAVRIVGMAELNDGANHPDCFNNGGLTDETQLAVMNFLVTNDRLFECMLAPVKFIWYDCGDNALSSVTGDTLLLSHNVYDYLGMGGIDTYVEIQDLNDGTFPTWYGAADLCFAGSFENKPLPLRHADFYNGGVDIICADSIDAPGDINLNGVAYEIADAVQFTNYFVQGLSAFGTHIDGSIAASDVNKDGITLSVADLVYLIRVVVGDAQPYPKSVAVHANFTQDAGVVSISEGFEVAAVHMVVEGDVTPSLRASDVSLKYEFDGTNTSILVTTDAERANHVATFSGAFLDGINGNIISMDAADYEGTQVLLKNVPVRYSLDQNYPNPFNPSTTIRFAVPTAGDYNLAIYNIQGQIVKTFSGTASSPDIYEIEWDASPYASGVYFYRLTAGDFSQTKKMIFLK